MVAGLPAKLLMRLSNPRRQLFNRSFIALTAFWATCLTALAIYHCWQIYCPVPVWDMWGGYLGFYEAISAGHWNAWWSRWGEHCILLDRLLFWIDLRCFRGSNIFLLGMNDVLAALCGCLFWTILLRRLPRREFTTTRNFLGLLSVSSLFLLCQGENLTWAFQGQFWLAFLLPFCALYWLQKLPDRGLTIDFLLACLFGVGAAGAMGNGITALPLMLAYAITTRQRKLRVLILFFLSIVICGLYLYAAGLPAKHSQFGWEAILYLLTVLGSPFLFLFRQPSLLIAQITGACFLVAAGYEAVKTLRKPRVDVLATTLVFFLLYVMISALAIAKARLPEHIEAPPSHYVTVAIMGWLSLLGAYSTRLAAIRRRWKLFLAVAVLSFMFLALRAQIKALDNWDEPNSERKALLLGLVLGVNDPADAVALAGAGGAPAVPSIAQMAYREHLGVLGWYPYRGAREKLGSQLPSSVNLPSCQGSIEGVENISDPRFFSMHGRLVYLGMRRRIQAVRLLDKQGVEVGFAIMGQTTPDRDKALGKRALANTFRGYVFSRSAGAPIVLEGEDRRGSICRSQANLPAPLYTAKVAAPDKNKTTVTTASVLAKNEWTGSDFFHANLCAQGLQIFGSVKSHGDADSGSITLRLTRGDQLFYRSGPAGGEQILNIPGYSRVILPVAKDWHLLTFSGATLPNIPFQATLTDAGTGWGEWSAIALRSDGSCQANH